MRTFTQLSDENGLHFVDLSECYSASFYWPAGRDVSIKLGTPNGAFAYVLATPENCAAIGRALSFDMPVPDKAAMKQKAPKAEKKAWVSPKAYWAKKNAEKKAARAAAGVDGNGEILPDAPISAEVGLSDELAPGALSRTVKRRGRPRKAPAGS